MARAAKKVAFVVGASRGIGRQVAVDLVRNGYVGEYHVVRDYSSIQNLLDVLVYNSGAIWWASGLHGTIQASLPHFRANGWKGRIIVVSPPIYSRFFRGKTAYAMGKVGMRVLTKGLAMDWEREGKREMAITSIWPAAAIQSAATRMAEKDAAHELRKPTIYPDAILAMLDAPAAKFNGCLELDEDFLRREGVVDFDKYNFVVGSKPRRIMPKLLPDLTVNEQDDEGKRMDNTKLRAKL
ncbi:NAD(P)-binding protein [Karstenula rhodostoma CBS 690.94]|uniref:NAD(P)-binding protein n=1 Tax=Karstenula rhodostoma CBS 690.94 TaxID=1392251 RepID=A0A9P4P8Z5_9PLEO|nr:NAD(P)-binding protein [Karstenula rhodostoma CBS 690.94]